MASSLGPSPFHEGHLLSQRVGDDEDVGEDNRRVEVEPAQGLQRYLRGAFGVEAQIQE